MGWAAAVLMMAAQPCLAAGDSLDGGMPERTTAAFAGAVFKLDLRGASGLAKPTARLQLGLTHSYSDPGSRRPAVVCRLSGLELGASAKGKPALFMAGQELTGQNERLEFGGSTGTTVLIAGGVVLALLLVVVAAGGGGGFPDTCPDKTGASCT